MHPDLQRRVQRYGWDKAAPYYEPFWQEQLRPAQDRLLSMARLKPGERVLDVACGSGLVTFPAARAVVPGGTVLGTDLSDEMVGTAQRNAQEQGIDNATFERMDAEQLDLPDGTSESGAGFDVVLCSLGLMYVPDPDQALREMRRVLRPGGRAVAAVWGARKNCGWAEVFPIMDRRVKTDVCPLFFQLGTGPTLEATFQAAGFEEIVTERFSTLLHYASDEAASRAAFSGGPVALAWQRFDEATQAEARAEYLESIAAYRNGDGYDIPGEFVVVRGHRP